MKKSFNDISRQLERVITLASQIGGNYTATATGRVDVQRFAQIAAKARTQHGISLFCTDKDEKKPFVYVRTESRADEIQETKLKPTELYQVEPVQLGTSKPRRELTAEEDAECRKKLQEIRREVERFLPKPIQLTLF